MININNRLKKLGDMILEGNSQGIIDVGCDHALLDIYLYEKNNTLKLVASDLRKDPLIKAKENIEKYSFSNNIKIKLSYGIDNLEDYIDTVVISGMGTETIIEILDKGKEYLSQVNRLVLSSNNKYYDLRKYVTGIGYIINKEEIIYEDGKYYTTIDFVKGNKEYKYEELYFGPYLLNNKNKEFIDYYTFIKSKKEQVLDKIPDNEDKEKLIKEIDMIASKL